MQCSTLPRFLTDRKTSRTALLSLRSFLSPLFLLCSCFCGSHCVCVCVCARARPVVLAPWVPACVCTERLDLWCSGPPLEEVSDVLETSHRRCSLMQSDDLAEPKL